MSKQHLNTYEEPTNKFLELTEDEQLPISKMAQRAFKRLNDKILTPTAGENRNTFKEGYIEMFESMQATIEFLTKERDSYKRQVK